MTTTIGLTYPTQHNLYLFGSEFLEQLIESYLGVAKYRQGT